MKLSIKKIAGGHAVHFDGAPIMESLGPMSRAKRWLDMIAAVHGRNVPERVAKIFSQNLMAYLGPEKMRAILDKNQKFAEAGDEQVCATHDYCDANVFMNEAIRRVTRHRASDFLQCDYMVSLFNQAWKIAKANKFYTEF